MNIDLNNRRLIYLSSLIAGALPMAYLLSNKRLKDRSIEHTGMVRFWGWLFGLSTYLVALLIIHTMLIPAGLFVPQEQGYAIAILVFVAVQTIMSGLFLLLCTKHYPDAFRFSANLPPQKSLLYYALCVLLGLSMATYLFAFNTFVFVVTMVYFLPNIFLYWRLKPFFNSTKSRPAFLVLYWLVVCAFPLGRFVGDMDTVLSKAVSYTGYYYAPFLLYSLLLLLVWDMVQLSVRLTSNKWPAPQKQKWVMAGIVLLTCAIEIAGAINFNNSKVQSYHIQVDKKEAQVDSLRIAVLTDSHLSEMTSRYFMRQMVAKVNALNADLVLFVGDVFESSQQTPHMLWIQDELKTLRATYGVVAVEGNHEYYNSIVESACFTNSGFLLLRDSVITLKNTVQLVGRMDKHNHHRQSLDSLLSGVSGKLPTIVLDHQPPHELQAINKADVYLSGHTHNGQLYPFNHIARAVYALAWGHRAVGPTNYFVSCGVQGWGPPVKTSSYSEIMEININFSERK